MIKKFLRTSRKRIILILTLLVMVGYEEESKGSIVSIIGYEEDMKNASMTAKFKYYKTPGVFRDSNETDWFTVNPPKISYKFDENSGAKKEVRTYSGVSGIWKKTQLTSNDIPTHLYCQVLKLSTGEWKSWYVICSNHMEFDLTDQQTSNWLRKQVGEKLLGGGPKLFLGAGAPPKAPPPPRLPERDADVAPPPPLPPFTTTPVSPQPSFTPTTLSKNEEDGHAMENLYSYDTPYYKKYVHVPLNVTQEEKASSPLSEHDYEVGGNEEAPPLSPSDEGLAPTLLATTTTMPVPLPLSITPIKPTQNRAVPPQRPRTTMPVSQPSRAMKLEIYATEGQLKTVNTQVMVRLKKRGGLSRSDHQTKPLILNPTKIFKGTYETNRAVSEHRTYEISGVKRWLNEIGESRPSFMKVIVYDFKINKFFKVRWEFSGNWSPDTLEKYTAKICASDCNGKWKFRQCHIRGRGELSNFVQEQAKEAGKKFGEEFVKSAVPNLANSALQSGCILQ